jgi:protein-S-isoprenylcysteine O-methyltransferase Ste14
VLIVLGLVAERRRLAFAGALLFFLPVFGHFAIQMFFLAGLGLLRLIWIPILDGAYGLTGDHEFWLFRLGDVAFLPYVGILRLGALLHLDLRVSLPYIMMGIGLFLFSLAVIAWFRVRWLNQGTARFWVYRFSRHPQYLGWIVWSYGLFLFFLSHHEGSHFQIGWGIPDSLPWLVSMMVIIGVALLEEIKMRREHGEEYEAYAARTPFLFPLPRFVSAAVSLPMQLVLRKKHPQRGVEVAVVVLLYLALLVFASWLMRERGFLSEQLGM